MSRKSPREQQTQRDIGRAQTLVSQVRGLTPDEAAHALESRASQVQVSLHAAALAVLATSPTDDLLTDGASS
jgi:hypothetical protein